MRASFLKSLIFMLSTRNEIAERQYYGRTVKPSRCLSQVHSMKSMLISVRTYATNSTTPPASLIFFSASLLKYRARTTNGISGILPLPRTLE